MSVALQQSSPSVIVKDGELLFYDEAVDAVLYDVA